MVYKLSEIIESGKTTQMEIDGKYLPARWLQFNDSSLPTRIKDAWLVLKGKAYAVEWR